ncbi:MAG: undecaprenyl-diphosphate phosphatase [Acidobacteria bacterium]|nr:undecaprenyl-diphosphate phosphatase [Acidobacteriota bacterium]
MPLVQVIVLAVLQGITEFLPISSSAHLALAPWLFGWKDQGLDFDIALHIGTTISVLIYFFRDWLQILANGLRMKGLPRFSDDIGLERNPNLLWYLIAATVPAGILGLLLKETVETTLRSPYLMGTMLVLVGLLMYAAEKRASQQRTLAEMTLADCLFIGCAQALALVPGTSRSGITLTAGLMRNLDRSTAARFSFLLSTPIVVAAAAKDALDLRKMEGLGAELLWGILISGVTGCLVISFLLKFFRTNSVKPFVIYRVIFGIIVIALAFARS